MGGIMAGEKASEGSTNELALVTLQVLDATDVQLDVGLQFFGKLWSWRWID